MRVLKFMAYVILSALITAGIGSALSSWRVMAALKSLGAPIDSGQAAQMIAYDLQHFATLYAVFIVLAFIVAFAVSGVVHRRLRFARPLIFAISGAFAIAVMLYLMKQVFFGVPIIAGARDQTGLALQILAGGLGGLVFAALTKPKVRA